MTQVLAFGEVLEAADHLSSDEQEELIAILHRRLAQAARQRLAVMRSRRLGRSSLKVAVCQRPPTK